MMPQIKTMVGQEGQDSTGKGSTRPFGVIETLSLLMGVYIDQTSLHYMLKICL